MPPVNLVFKRAPYAGGPLHLVFGADAAPVDPPVTVHAYVLLSGAVSVSATVAVPAVEPVTASVAVLLLGVVSVSAVAQYDIRLTPQLDQRAAARHQVATPARIDSRARWQVSAPQRETCRQPWALALPDAHQTAIAFDAATAMHPQASSRWQQGAQAATRFAAAHQRAMHQQHARSDAWQHAEQRPVQAAVPLQTGIYIVLHMGAPWQTARAHVRDHTGRSGARRQLRGLPAIAVPWQRATHPRNGISMLPLPPVVPPRVPSTHLVFSCPPRVGGAAHLVFGHVCAYKPALVSVPVRRVYVTINSIDLRRVAGDVALPADAFSLTLDADSWTFSWSASLHKSAEPLVSLFDELEARINGVPYRLAVGKVARDRRFPQTRLKVSGRGLAQVLADPQAPVVSYGNTAQRTAQQLMDDVLTVNGVSIGWDIDWGLTDWLVPANAWAFQGTAMQALADIAGAAGGYVQPHPTSRILRVLPRYPAAPWTWGGVTPDLELPAAVCEVESFERVERPGYNRVYVGGASQGVFGPVTRTGTAGDVLAPQVTHPLITDSAAHRQRGLAELADSGSQVHLSLTLPVLPETGLILPGTMARYTADQTRMGIVRSTSLTWSSPVMRQTIGLECHEPA